ncbi:TetR/AcrR family transcriptional regulator [Kribbella kalugense]|uniref:TetR family transcriptional regulator n=1 Tax=Kribbella kalugense TaxID=2512221 RepID=A0A4R7ZUV8_9ACTN|nr:TetR/AcrR family transcriptional regulator [Kribbella kalugense]TDW19360.1 TetR family transcriptional regulator [Kribbella kalugense]
MPTQTRRERARDERRTLILRTARDLAESEGWDAVTTRRLAEAVDYSQPVLYGHFKNMDAIAGAVALEGIGELAAVLQAADGLHELARAYLEYAETHPAVYEAMFTRSTDLVFGTADSPSVLKAAFAAIRAAVEPYADGKDTETLTEVFWSALHGQATLTRGHRLRPTHAQPRADTLVALITSAGQHPLSGRKLPDTD